MLMVASAAIAALGAIMDANAQNKAWAEQETARRKQRMEMMRQANVMDAHLKLQDRSNFEAARIELENQTLSHIKASATVNAAINESNLEGRSMDRARTEVDNVYLRTKGMINTNYERDYHNIFVQRDDNRTQLISSLNNDVANAKPSRFGQMANTAGAAANGAMAGSQMSDTIAGMPKASGGGKAKAAGNSSLPDVGEGIWRLFGM